MKNKKNLTDDVKEWGDAWVYCKSHLRPHKTGWCTVGVEKKVCLGDSTMDREGAINKCREFGLEIYSSPSGQLISLEKPLNLNR